MPEKTKKTGQRYHVDGKRFTWYPDAGDGEDDLGEVVLPLRVKLKHIREMADRVLDADAMALILENIAPQNADTYAEMDLNDFQAMFTAWQDEYQALAGATLGE